MGSLRPRMPGWRIVLAVLLSASILTVVLWTLWPLDMPLVRFVRSLHSQWLEWVGNVGYWLGSGWVLAAISAGMLGIGYAFKQPNWRKAGIEGLIAHAAAGAVAQGFKHLIGRPRPRFAHLDQMLLAPSWESGLDSFPSGHAAASLAVATVIARHFPRVGWIAYGLASGVAISRVLGGSHFPTDVLVGAVIGLLLGSIVANPIRLWRESLGQALVRITPVLVVVFVLLWTMTQSRSPASESAGLVFLGLALVAIGIGRRLFARLWVAGDQFLPWPNGMIAAGVVMTTGSLLAATLAALAAIAKGLLIWQTESPSVSRPLERQQATLRASWVHVLIMELLAAGGWGLAGALLHGLNGVLPLR